MKPAWITEAPPSVCQDSDSSQLFYHLAGNVRKSIVRETFLGEGLAVCLQESFRHGEAFDVLPNPCRELMQPLTVSRLQGPYKGLQTRAGRMLQILVGIQP